MVAETPFPGVKYGTLMAICTASKKIRHIRATKRSGARLLSTLGRGVVGDRDGDRAGAEVSGGVAGPCGQGVGAVAGRSGVPGNRVGGAGVLRAEVGAVELELDAGHAHIVGRAGRHGDAAGD